MLLVLKALRGVIRRIPMDPYQWTDQQLRVWNYLEKQDLFYPVNAWPPWAQAAAVNLHKNDTAMYNLMFFLIGNGLDPHHAMRFTLMGDARPNPILGNYHSKRFQDAQRIVTKAKAGELFQGKKNVFDMILGRPIKM